MQEALLILLIVFFPYLAVQANQRFKLGSFFSPVVLCYVAGMLVSNTHLIKSSSAFRETCSGLCIALALPLLLYASDFVFIRKNLRPLLASFALAVGSAVLAPLVLAFFFFHTLPNIGQALGMLIGVYIGGTVNLFAVGQTLGADANFITLVNAADVMTGGVYLLLLSSIGPSLFGRFLPLSNTRIQAMSSHNETSEEVQIDWRAVVKCLFSALVVAGSSIGLTILLSGKINQSVLMLVLTTLSLGAASLPVIRRLKGSFAVGEYLLMMFCICLGLMADLTQLQDNGPKILFFAAVTLLGTVLLHLILAKIFKIDLEAFMITSTATIFGPPFIPQISTVLNNPKLILPGIAAALAGIALANYLGSLVGKLYMYFNP
jgi:uncharacterized membrane protein